MRIYVAQINPKIGDLAGNTSKILNAITQAKSQDADIVLFPEMAVCGYPPQDLLLKPQFCEAVEQQLPIIQKAVTDIAVVIGTIRRAIGQKFLYNTAAIIDNGELLGFQDKILLPTYDVFDELRYFEPGQKNHVWNIHGQRVAVTICEDIWQHGKAVIQTNYERDPIREFVSLKPDLLLNLSASPYSRERIKTRFALCQSSSQTLECPVVLCNQVGGNDSLIFDGNSLGINAQGKLIAQANAFQEHGLMVDTETQSEIAVRPDSIGDLHDALVLGIRDYFGKQCFKKAVVGLSGGIDSAVVLVLAAEALGPQNVLGINMPSRYSSEGSVADAEALAHNLGCQCRNISVEKPFASYLELLEPHFEGKPADTTEENLQARIRGMILMSFSNKFGYLVLATGNKSELAMGYATLYGDMCGGLGVISDVTKHQVYALARWMNRHREIIPKSTIDKPPSAELRPNQLDSDSLPDYSIVDAVLEDYIEHNKSPEEIAAAHHYALDLVQDLVKRIHRNEYKRRQAAPGLRVSQKAFSVGRHFPIVQSWV